jgi:hypothetical protein
MIKVRLILLFTTLSSQSFSQEICNSTFAGGKTFRLSIKNEVIVPQSQINSVRSDGYKYMNESVEKWFQRDNVESAQKCLSCHTTLPYMMLGAADNLLTQKSYIRELVQKRTKNFKRDGFVSSDNRPWYEIERSYSTESVLNASAVVMPERLNGANSPLSELAKDAYDLMWKRQKDDGSFAWLDQFGLRPHESQNSGYWGTSMAGIMGGLVETQASAQLKKTFKYLGDNFKSQSVHNKLFGVWANAQSRGNNFLSESQLKNIISDIKKNQNIDGGWSSDFILGTGNKETDPYATSIIAFILKKSGQKVPNANVVKGYLVDRFKQSSTQAVGGRNMTGAITSPSPNGRQGSDFFSDMATSYGLMYLNN